MTVHRSIDPENQALIVERSEPGWFRFTAGDRPLDLFVRGELDEAGRAVVAELHIVDAALDSVALRAIPLGRITRALNSPNRRDWLRRAQPGPSAHLRQLLQATDKPKPPSADESAPAPLQRPPRGRGGGEEFYRRVAAAYLYQAQRSRRPAVEIARQAGVPAATARRWIEQARVRGVLGREGHTR